MKMTMSVRVFLILVYLLFAVIASANSNASTFQPINDTLSERDLAQLNRYPKASTKLSSVSIDPVVSYLNVQSGQTADLPITSQNRLNQRSDFTIMFWFKVDALPSAGQFMQILSIQRTLSCFIDSQPSVQCDSAGIEPLRVTSGQLVEGKWNHLTVAFFAETSTGYVMLQDDFNVPAISYSKDASVVQAVGPWSACVGSCMPKRSGFVGGLREFLVRNRYILPDQAKLQKNEIVMYSPDIRAYYRFSYDSDTFFKDQFTTRSFFWRSGAQNQTIADWRGGAMIPVNVCPRTFNYTQLYRFDLAQQMRLIQLSSSSGKATKYSYQMSITFYKNGTSCNTQNILSAQNGCNLVLLEDVFMLYFQSPNRARFFFDATKNFYQTQSVSFFIPDNQWITVKLFMNQQSGYQIFVLDQNDNILSQLSKSYDMQQQSPKRKLYLFQSLVGYVGMFTLSEEVVQTPSAKFIPKSPIIKLDFRATFNQNGQPSAQIQNSGGNKQPTQLMFSPVVDLVVSPFQPLLKTRVFDGITCNDGHQVLSFDNNLSYLNFTTSPLEFIDNSQNSSIEFWFKFRDSSMYNTSSQLFQMIDPYVDPFEDNYTYWVIFLNNSALNIAPFGMGGINESAAIVFSDFKFENEDGLGWWHIACTFQFNVSIKCYLSNTIAQFQNGYSMVNVVKAFPTYSLDAHFGFYKGNNFSPVKMLLKEVRIWKKVLSESEVKANKQLQIDPTYDDDILVYLRLNSLKNAFFNMVQLNQINSFNSYGSQKMISQVPDMTLIPITRYNEITGLLEFTTEPQSHVVCPSYTYLKEQLCYSEPVNEAVLAVFPVWDADTGVLSWIFTLQYSSMVDNSFFTFMKYQWSANDQVLAKLLKGDQLIQTVSSVQLRQESIYQVHASMTNPAVTFSTESQIQFIPNSCQWFEVEGSDAFSAYQQLLDLPGQSDLAYSLILRQSTDPSCNQRRFYNQFSSLSFQYFVSGSAQRVGVQPKANYTLSGASSLLDVAQSSDLKIDVLILASELANLPTFTDVRILMSVEWTSSLYADLLADSDSDVVFQHVLYTVNYQTPDSTLLTVYVKPKSSVVAINQTLLIDASNVTTRNIDMQFAIIAYSWQCPSFFEVFCKSQSSSILALPWKVFEESDAPFGEYLQFQATVALVKDSQVIFITTVQSQAMWFDIMKPEFKIDFRPNPILISNSQETRFTIVPVNFDQSKFQNFTIQWQVYGQLAGRQSISFQNLSQVMVVPQDSWRINSTYSISCVLTYTQSMAITTNNSFVVNIYGQPFGGLTYISPKQGYLGDTFFIYLQGWESYLNTDTIVYTVFTSLDDLGNQIGQQLTQRRMFQNETFYFVAQSTFPLIVKISDITGEVTISRVVGTIINGTNPALSQQSFMQRLFGGFGSRHLSQERIDEFAIESNECSSFGSKQLLNDILNQTTCRNEQIFLAAKEIANSTCQKVDYSKTTEILTLYDALVNQNSPCKTQETLLIQVLDLAHQYLASQDGDLQFLSRLKTIQTIDSFSGTNFQILSERVTINHNATLKALGVNYLIIEQNTLDLNELDQGVYLQLIAVKSSQFQSFASVQIYNPDSQKIVSISGNSGQITLSFDIIPEHYLANITVCAVFSLSDDMISTESCLTELVSFKFQVKCTCNIMLIGDVVTLTRDYSREQGSPVTFPNHQLVVFSSGIEHIQKSSYVFIAIIGAICLYGLAGFIVACRMDKRDLLERQEFDDQTDQTILNLVSTRLERPIPLVKLHLRELKSYMSPESSLLVHIGRATHPVLNPFIYYCQSQTRALRFSSYHSQVNTMVILVLVCFGRHYRQRDHRFEEVLDLTDIQSVCYSIVIGSISLIPTVSNTCNQLLQARNNSSRLYWLRGIFYFVSFVLNLSIVIVSVYTAYQAPASNQYLIAMAIVGSLVGSAVFTNLARVFFNSYKLPAPISYLQSKKAKSILEEVECMRQIQQELSNKSASARTQIDVLNTESEIQAKQQTDQASIELSESGALQTTRGLNEGFRE